ncbi:hypothetical protein [Spirosoma oryzicola]|uniref:hypothetical protein n=1 Tax=Spirosoma oryzicola TaxID=2898794 RepID=UPI001E4500E8|nr:hypothetical protein [Spirosoma oryzicola]UHG93405.1 hypothetical protein LQ777_10980 [Spirosoma oryzicola]
MLKIKLKLTPGEVNVLYMYSTQAFMAWSDLNNRPYMLGSAMQLAEHYERIRKQVYNWAERPANKEYRYTLPMSIAWSYYEWLNKRAIHSLDRTTLLGKLNRAFVDCHVITQNGYPLNENTTVPIQAATSDSLHLY